MWQILLDPGPDLDFSLTKYMDPDRIWISFEWIRIGFGFKKMRSGHLYQERNQDFAKEGGLKIEEFSDVILMAYFR